MNSTLSAKLLDDYEILDSDENTTTQALPETSCSESNSIEDIVYVKQHDQAKDLETSQGFLDVMSCIKSEEDFQRNCCKVLHAIQMNNSSYNDSLLEALTTVFAGSKYSGTFKFYSLFLLIKLIETKNDLFTSQLTLEKKLHVQLTSIAEEIAKTRHTGHQANDLKGVSSFLLSKANNLRDLIKNTTKSKNTESNSEVLQRQKFEDLLLEAIKFWNSKYGKSVNKSPLAKIYCSLREKVTFPEKYVYLADYNPKGPGEVASITGGPSFAKNYSLVVNIFNGASGEKAKKFLEGTKRILSSPDVWAASKFYALYLLVKITESRSSVFMNMFAQSRDLLNLLFSQAQCDSAKSSKEQGSKIFSRKPHPQEAIIGRNYLELLLEAISFWGTVYGTEEKTHAFYIFYSMKSRLQSRVLTQSYYVPRNIEELDRNLLEMFELIDFKELPEIPEDYVIKHTQKAVEEPTVEEKESVETTDASQSSRLQLEVIFDNLKKINKFGCVSSNALQKRLSQLSEYFSTQRRKMGYQDIRSSLLPLLGAQDH